MTLNGHMMETDEPVCVLICLGVQFGQQDQKLVKNKQKISDFAPKILEIQLCRLNLVLRQLQ